MRDEPCRPAARQSDGADRKKCARLRTTRLTDGPLHTLARYAAVAAAEALAVGRTGSRGV